MGKRYRRMIPRLALGNNNVEKVIIDAKEGEIVVRVIKGKRTGSFNERSA